MATSFHKETPSSGTCSRSFKRERPIQHKHVVDWDIRLVLSFFQSGRFRDWSRLSDRELTLKTLFLVALATGKRRSELHALSTEVKWIKGGLRTAELTPVADFVSKTHMAMAGLGALKPIVLRSLDDMAGSEGKEEKLLCPVHTLAYYLERSKEYRSECQKRLFISYRRGMSKDISKQTILAYLKEAILMAYDQKGSAMGVVGVHVKAHSVRHVATSLSALKHYSMEDVLKAGVEISWCEVSGFEINDLRLVGPRSRGPTASTRAPVYSVAGAGSVCVG